MHSLRAPLRIYVRPNLWFLAPGSQPAGDGLQEPQMNQLAKYAPLAGRLLIAAVFLPAGLMKLADVAGFAGYVASGGLPGFLAWPAIVFEVALGAAMLAGYQTRIMALLGAGFCLLTGLLYHFAPADMMQMTMFYKNLAIAGGFLMIFANGAGAVALDRA
jgi:putative oxidoreductase